MASIMMIPVGIVSILTGVVNLQYLQVFMKIPVGIGLSIDTILASEDTLIFKLLHQLSISNPNCFNNDKLTKQSQIDETITN